MARLPYQEPESHPELAAVIDHIRGARGGRLIKLYKLLLHSPPIAEGWLSLGGALRYDGLLDGRTRELAIVRVALLTRAQYEYAAHVRYALQAGATQVEVDALPHWRESAEFDDRMRTVLAYTDAMTTDVQVGDDVFAAVRAHLDDRELLELTVNVAFYNMVSRVLEALAIDPEDPTAPGPLMP